MKNYLLWYWRRYGSQSNYTSFEDFAQTIGPYPGAGFKLYRLDTSQPISRANHAWATQESFDAADDGRLEPPHTPDHPKNADRFALLVSDRLAKAKRRQSWERRYQELDQATKAIYDKVLTKLAHAGMDASAWRDPGFLSDSRFMNEARERLTAAEAELQKHVEDRPKWLENPERPRYRGGRPGKHIPSSPDAEQNSPDQDWEKAINSTNRIRTGRPGRPRERYRLARAKIADLTPKQREALKLPPSCDKVQTRGPTGQISWKRVIRVRVNVDDPTDLKPFYPVPNVGGFV